MTFQGTQNTELMHLRDSQTPKEDSETPSSRRSMLANPGNARHPAPKEAVRKSNCRMARPAGVKEGTKEFAL